MLKSLVKNPTVKVLSLHTPLVQTSTTVLLKLIQHMVVMALKHGFTKVKFLPEAKQPAKKASNAYSKARKHQQFRGRMKGRAMRGNTVSHGEFGLV